MSENRLMTNLTEKIGAYGVQCSETKQLAPLAELTDALGAVEAHITDLQSDKEILQINCESLTRRSENYMEAKARIEELEAQLVFPAARVTFAEKATEIINKHETDPEASHSESDKLMEDLLIQLGFGYGVALIRASTRW
ncbi:MAG: hypothetical protein JRC86_04800 [Deltaproteobacteria bacterium]|nr:hypothetical protein [Deltaproteobacteria bacterium]